MRSLKIGKTQLIVRDHKNFNNWDAIDVEVAQLNQLAWIEQQSEMKANTEVNLSKYDLKEIGESRVLSLIALDSLGRKFTNCTAVRPSFRTLEQDLISMADPSVNPF